MGIKKIGFVGVGDISGIYLENITKKFKELEIAGVCDLVREKAERAAEKYGIPKIYNDMYELFADPEVDIVLNITRPNEHYGVTKAALEAGKPVYSEKPLAATLELGRELAALAAEKGLLLGGAPDTFMGAGIQGCRKLLEEGVIGQPIGGMARLICHGHETWHPDPEFYYKTPGGGPMLDMGPYYVTALVNLLGPVQSVMGMAKQEYPTRTITSKPLHGTIIDVDCPTYEMGLIRFKSGAIVQIFMTFDVYSMPGLPCIEIYGTHGNMTVPNPNNFSGDIQIKVGESNPANVAFGSGDWVKIDTPYTCYENNSRALGLADLAKALETGREPRAAVQQTLHVLEVMRAFRLSSDSGREVQIEAPFELQPAMPIVGEEGVIAG
ncbi:MAG: Gfo/Idh/MocA family oxidoreductase [Oscillospiraceae bacterium]|jgi:predicted dehydrogenase|nr:Gfo/Idh/MocA family oxidoreductase [Oscillospiraceae bacterium]